MKKYLTEFIGTFFLILTIALTGDPLAIGASLMVMIFAGGHISGAHYNPAVSLAVWLRGKLQFTDMLLYMLCQLLGATAAAFIAMWLMGNHGFSAMTMDNSMVMKAIAAEALGTFALAYVVLNVATAKGTNGNSFYGLAIGFTVFACAVGLGKISGGAFNPAVAVGQSWMGAFSWSNIWIYLVGCFGGAMIAAYVFSYDNPDDK